jgi:glucokinase
LAALAVYAQALKGYNDSLLIGKTPFDFQHLFQAYRQGDRIAKQTAHYCMDLWATALVAFIHAYDPEAIIIGGGVMQSQDIILPYLRSKTKSSAWTAWHEVQIIPASLNDQAGIFGAYELYRNRDRKNV